MKTKLLISTTFILSVCLVIGGIAAEKEMRIRPIVHINNDLFDGDAPTEVLCLVVKSLISNDAVSQIWVYHIRTYSEAVGFYTTYYARDPFWDPEDDVKPYLGEYRWGEYWGYPDFDPPILVYGCTPLIKYAYHVVITDYPRYWDEYLFPIEDYIQEDDPIAWAKTVNAIGQPVDWWNWTQGGGFEFYSQFPPYPIPNFNNFPHPQGPTFQPGWPTYWPGDPDDECHWDWCPPDDWPEELPEDEPYAHDWMTLEMVIDDWDTWDDLWDEDIWDQGRWVQ